MLRGTGLTCACTSHAVLVSSSNALHASAALAGGRAGGDSLLLPAHIRLFYMSVAKGQPRLGTLCDRVSMPVCTGCGAGANPGRVTQVAVADGVPPRLKQPQAHTSAFRRKCAAGDQHRRPSTTCDLHGCPREWTDAVTYVLSRGARSSLIKMVGVRCGDQPCSLGATTLTRNAVVDVAARSSAGVITSR